MKYLKNRLIVLMLMLMIPNAWTLADNCYLSDNHHPIQIKASHVQGVPKGFTIQAVGLFMINDQVAGFMLTEPGLLGFSLQYKGFKIADI